MSSYISPFKAWIAAAIFILVVEAGIYIYKAPDPFDRTNFLQFSFLRDETPQRLFVHEKIKAFAFSNPDIVQSGDSSGFHGIDPRIVRSDLPPSTSYLNMSCCANLGFRGYYNILDLMARNNSSIKYMVLHVTPYTMPRPETWDSDGAALWAVTELKVFGDAVYDAYLSVWRIFQIPSLAYRRRVTDYFYYADGFFNEPDRPLLNNAHYLEFLKVFRESSGFLHETDARVEVSSAECEVPPLSFFKLREMRSKTYLEEVLDSYADLAARHRAKLVVVFQPVACSLGTGNGSREARTVIDNFKRAHPEVEIPFPLIETWPADMFSVPAHVKAEYSDKIGHRLGRALAEIMARNASR
ncbi:hypothetical protein [Tardiphaga robiniae]|uniref:SGNH/GDSL hydrolase family protein n=1 Tax=Tardiphaga robiniae TaxID=943830 RepID=A0A7G6TU98_9BRAD|nr:hypothetical protein [Tardiphaga robiniae]QND70330.1 hypothetical protein HB776_03060 [Tardiphaga robiniae]